MKKSTYLLLFLLSLVFFSLNFLFQKTAGYPDAEYYYLGGKYLAHGQFSAPVVWNYLDDPLQLSHPLFTYWMPFPSILSMLPMRIFQNDSFFFGRFLFWLLAAAIPPLAAYAGFHVFKSRFVALIAALLAIFSGFYFKYYSIPESVTIYMFFGGILFLLLENMVDSNRRNTVILQAAALGVLSGILHLSRVDGIVILALVFCALEYQRFFRKDTSQYRKNDLPVILVLLVGYLAVTGWWYARNLGLFGALFSPASGRALWISEYNDTFLYPASLLTFSHWMQNGWPLKTAQIWNALKTNLGSLLAVQLGVTGFPLVILALRRHWRRPVFLLSGIYFCVLFVLMTFVFSEAGSRGGFLHAMAAIQIPLWILIADGLQQFIQWGIRKRGWKDHRAKIMFGSALIAFALLLTAYLYTKDVIGATVNSSKWDSESAEFEALELQARLTSADPRDVIMINNPSGYHLATNRWSIAIPKAGFGELAELIDLFDVRFIVLDQNLPAGLEDIQQWVVVLDLQELSKTAGGKTLYEVP